MTRISSHKTLFKNYYLELVENTLEYGHGKTAKHVDVYRRPAVSVFPIDDENNIYLIKNYRYLLEGYILEAVAGIIEDGENPVETAKRELREEAGIIAEELVSAREVYLAGSFLKVKQNLVVAKKLKFDNAEPEEIEDIEVVKMSIKEALDKVYSGEINTSVTIIGILLLDKMLKEKKI